MRIDFIFDTVCPWCFVGKRRLEKALAQRPGTGVRIGWRPFLLNPDMPEAGMERGLYLERKFGGPQRVQRVHDAVAAAGKAEGIDFAFERIARMPSSLNSHRLIRFAAQSGREKEAIEAVYAAYFQEGRDIGAIDELVAIGRGLGLSAAALEAHLRSDADIIAIANENGRAHRLGVNGVPCIILDGAYAMAGAQDPDILLRLLDIARETEAEAALS